MFNILEKHRLNMGMGGGGMGGGGMGGGGMGGACYVYPDAPATPGIVTPDVSFGRVVDMNIPVTMDDGTTINMWGFTDTTGNGGVDGMGGMMGGGGGATFPSAAIRLNQGQIPPRSNQGSAAVPRQG
jgi:hypothetical protein